jgi:lipopolysaccharide/colanic/teichoic acid biosynthesis glycosyltransferase
MPQPRLLPWSRVAALLVATDCFAVLLGLMSAHWLRFDAQWLIGLEPRDPTLPAVAFVPLVPLWIGAYAISGLYQRRNLVSGLREYRDVLEASTAVVLLVVVMTYLVQVVALSRGFVVLALGAVTIAVWVGRFTVRRFIYRAADRGVPLDRILMVGANHQAVAIATLLTRTSSAASQVTGFLSEYVSVGQVVTQDLRVLGEPLQLSQVANEVGATRAVVVESGLSWESLQEVVRNMHHRDSIEVSLVPGLFDLHATPMAPSQLGPVLMLSPHPARVVGIEAVFKRGFDIAVGSVALAIALPVMALMMLGAAQQGHALGLQRRKVLSRGKEISLVRFAYPTWAEDRHLSRLPELVAVIRGTISFVGPRPISVVRAAAYGRTLNLIESAKPGFVGPWRLVGMARPDDFHEELAYDLFYMRNYSLWSDLQVLIHVLRYFFGSTRPSYLSPAELTEVESGARAMRGIRRISHDERR